MDTIVLNPVFQEPYTTGIFVNAVVPGFPGDIFQFNIPELIGENSHRIIDYPEILSEWQKIDNGALMKLQFLKEGACSLTVILEPKRDVIDFTISLTNISDNKWEKTFAFNCLAFLHASSFFDPGMERTFIRINHKFSRLCNTRRTIATRPLQFYLIKGKDGPLWFLNMFQAVSPDLASEPFIATVSVDGRKVVAAAVREASFLFNNCEYSCIHAASNIGEVPSGEERKTTGRFYFMFGSLDEVYQRYRKDFCYA